MTRGRKALPPSEKKGPEFLGATAPEHALVEAEATKRVTALAKQLNYSGALTPDAFEDIVYNGMRHSVQGALEMGIGLLLMKESSGHGYFLERLKAHGIEKSMAQRYMSAALKFSNAATSRLLESAGNQSKLLELVVLDDESIETLESGGSVGDVNLDKIDRMGVRELRKALRDSRAQYDAREKTIETKNKEIDRLQEKASLLPKMSSEIKVRELVQELRATLEVGLAPDRKVAVAGLKSLMAAAQDADIDIRNDLVEVFAPSIGWIAEVLDLLRLIDVTSLHDRLLTVVRDGAKS